jgi:predicted metalloprotease with PDZ domain
MRLMWQKYGKTEIPYTLTDLETTLATYTGDRAFAKEFFARYIRGRDVVDFATLLAPAGLVLRPAASTASMGQAQFSYDSTGATIGGYTIIGTPLYQAGLDRGDLITTLDGKPFTSDSVWTGIRATRKAGDQVAVEYTSRGVKRSASITLASDSRS